MIAGRAAAWMMVGALACTMFGACKDQRGRDKPSSGVAAGVGPGVVGAGPSGSGGNDTVGGNGGEAQAGGGTGGAADCDGSGDCSNCAACAHVALCTTEWIDCNNDPDCLSAISCLQDCHATCVDDTCYQGCRASCEQLPGFAMAGSYLGCLCDFACSGDCAAQQARDCIQFVQ